MALQLLEVAPYGRGRLPARLGRRGRRLFRPAQEGLVELFLRRGDSQGVQHGRLPIGCREREQRRTAVVRPIVG
ncbi:hypothetical protein [Streptomyces zaomyceticus]|uniref:hypothetical protein n=1 Tax=Streptomyces zaomyceticus TaxID=68286 RepID=UPI0016748E59|nr:hypothetical protein [Streptomyces zaomyceticus]GHG26098.1 hypothetical protein GCM10018791_47520 [Streptomyces zaomyceticus]